MHSPCGRKLPGRCAGRGPLSANLDSASAIPSRTVGRDGSATSNATENCQQLATLQQVCRSRTVPAAVPSAVSICFGRRRLSDHSGSAGGPGIAVARPSSGNNNHRGQGWAPQGKRLGLCISHIGISPRSPAGAIALVGSIVDALPELLGPLSATRRVQSIPGPLAAMVRGPAMHRNSVNNLMGQRYGWDWPTSDVLSQSILAAIVSLNGIATRSAKATFSSMSSGKQAIRTIELPSPGSIADCRNILDAFRGRAASFNIQGRWPLLHAVIGRRQAQWPTRRDRHVLMHLVAGPRQLPCETHRGHGGMRCRSVQGRSA